MSEKVEVKCPKCGTIRTIKGTEERVRCSNKDTCGGRFYTKDNFVLKEVKNKDKKKEKGTPSGQKYDIVTPSKSKFFETHMMGIDPGDIKHITDNTIKVLFDNLDKSITSVWGPRPSGKNKWDAKYNMWLAFKVWALKQIVAGLEE